MKRSRYVLLFSLAILLVTIIGCASMPVRSDSEFIEVTSIRGRTSDTDVITARELSDNVVTYAKHYIAIVEPAYNELIKQADTPQARFAAQQRKIDEITSVFAIATGPDPKVNFLDMVVFVSLGMAEFEEYWMPQYFNNQADDLLQRFRKLENEIWELAARVLTTEHQQDLRVLIQEWHKNNPDLRFTHHIRFKDLATLDRDTSLTTQQKSGGLLPEVQDFNLSVEEMNSILQQLILTIKMLPAFARWEGELAFYGMAIQPEFKQLHSISERLTDSSVRLANTLDNAESIGESLMNHAFRLGVILIILFFIALTCSLLAYRYLSEKFIKNK
jgi:hypothetical protein